MTDIERLRELPAFLDDHDHADQCHFWLQKGTEESCNCGLKDARATAKGIPTLLADYERLRGMEERVKGAAVGRIVSGRANSFPGFHVEIEADVGFFTGQTVALVPVPGGEGK